MSDWEERYQDHDVQWDKGEPSPGLVDWLEEHGDEHGGKVIVPGCGFGHDVRAWAKSGFDCQGVDIAPSAIKGAKSQTPDLITNAIFRIGNFLDEEPLETFDFVFEHTFFCAIDPSRRTDYLQAVLRHLKPNGQLLAVHYILPKDEEGPPFGTDKEEVLHLFSPRLKLIGDWIPRSFPHRKDLEHMFLWRRL